MVKFFRSPVSNFPNRFMALNQVTGYLVAV